MHKIGWKEHIFGNIEKKLDTTIMTLLHQHKKIMVMQHKAWIVRSTGSWL